MQGEANPSAFAHELRKSSSKAILKLSYCALHFMAPLNIGGYHQFPSGPKIIPVHAETVKNRGRFLFTFEMGTFWELFAFLAKTPKMAVGNY